MKFFRYFFISAIALTLSGCPSQPYKPSSNSSSQQTTQPQQPTEPVEPVSSVVKPEQIEQAKNTYVPPAVRTMLDNARSKAIAGNMSGAIAEVERALRIAPNYAPSYIMLSKLYLSEGNNHQAAEFARKGLGYAQTASEKNELNLLYSRAQSSGAY